MAREQKLVAKRHLLLVLFAPESRAGVAGSSGPARVARSVSRETALRSARRLLLPGTMPGPESAGSRYSLTERVELSLER